ncbi:sodium-dependent transporter [uncultured Sphaerochaeta sp.]|uniref:sodium-dependent transporter n=1 Tax=uncultured Sphaerochaeta sp. TaxID=886478 RepID=UPI002A0A115F|nr:sodium-dependent transporter [uncultured Sphaerochaeta sp.]
MENKRETLKSRLGFILLSAGCAIGLGNVWRFPYIAGKYGGAAFVLIYLLFLFILGLPIMIMEFSIGRASKQNIGLALKTLEPPKTKWHLYGPVAIIGNYVLMMFYTTISGWLLAYFFHTLKGDFQNLDTAGVANSFTLLLQNPKEMIFWMVLSILLGFLPVAKGLQNGVEKISKWIMSGLLALILILAINSLTLKGGASGLRFYLLPDFHRMQQTGLFEAVYAAMGQAFFTLSIGIGSLSIFGSYIGRDKTLTGESVRVITLDTFVALCSGLIIFPACSAFGVQPNAGPSLIFVTLPNIFNQMAGGRIWGSLFFAFMSFAALSTLIAVFENITSYWIDAHHTKRKKACLYNGLAIVLLSLPCLLGFNLLSAIQPLGEGTTILDLEDFLVSSTLLPLGSLIFTLFCCTKYGWGWKNFTAEADAGSGLKVPKGLKVYFQWILPIFILVLFVKGYWDIFLG